MDLRDGKSFKAFPPSSPVADRKTSVGIKTFGIHGMCEIKIQEHLVIEGFHDLHVASESNGDEDGDPLKEVQGGGFFHPLTFR